MVPCVSVASISQGKKRSGGAKKAHKKQREAAAAAAASTAATNGTNPAAAPSANGVTPAPSPAANGLARRANDFATAAPVKPFAKAKQKAMVKLLMRQADKQVGRSNEIQAVV